ncbi:hypothetical protein BT69DRAFT_1297544 [Atractiella rhizophila]|nr:hypothetical protein BT69DRAFT_1297544 [Atractiella rhizophila]
MDSEPPTPGYLTPNVHGARTPGRARSSSLINRVLLGPNHHKVHPSTKPFLKAFMVGYLFDVLPRLLGMFLRKSKKSRRGFWYLLAAIRIIRDGFRPGRLALSAGISLGGAKFLDGILQQQLANYRESNGRSNALSAKDQYYSSLTAASASSLIGISILKSPSESLSLTLFSLVRALDTAFRILYRKLSALEAFDSQRSQALLDEIAKLGDIFLFWISSWRIMWVWFYQPELLPPSYVLWISRLSRVDHRLLQVLRHARAGEWQYGKRPIPGSAADLVTTGLAKSMDMPIECVSIALNRS